MNDQAAFCRTIQALDGDNFRRTTVGLICVAAVFAGWTWWMLHARVSVQNQFLSPAALALRASGVRNP